MEKRTAHNSAGRNVKGKSSDSTLKAKPSAKRQPKMSEYGLQLREKQKVKKLYGVRERQFRRFFGIAERSKQASGEMLISLLERRLDNVLYRLKLASSRLQARQLITHGHIFVNNKKVSSPSYITDINESISITPKALEKESFIDQVVKKRLKTSAQVPEWLELNKNNLSGHLLRYPVKSDVLVPIEETLIVELYSK